MTNAVVVPQATLLYVMVTALRDPTEQGESRTRIILGRKQRSIGAGKFNAPGGRCKQGEAPLQAAVREFEEETWLSLSDVISPDGPARPRGGEPVVVQQGVIRFRWPAKPDNDMDVHVFVAHGEYVGGFDVPYPRETVEMHASWFELESIPWGEMWPTDKLWLPQVLAGRYIEADIEFEPQGEFPQKAVIAQVLDTQSEFEP